MPERPNKWHIFEKRIVQGYQIWYSHVLNAQIQEIQIQNTQIHKYSIWRSARKTQHVVYFWKEDCSGISKIIFLYGKRANTKNTTKQISYMESPDHLSQSLHSLLGLIIWAFLYNQSVKYTKEIFQYIPIYDINEKSRPARLPAFRHTRGTSLSSQVLLMLTTAMMIWRLRFPF